MKFLFHNLNTKLLALLGAIVFWFFLLGTQNNFYSLAEPVSVELLNLNENLSVNEELSIKLKLSAADQIHFQGISAEDFEASLDLEDLEEGEYELPVSVISKLSNVSIIKIEPKEVRITIEEAQEESFPIKVSVKGSPAADHNLVGTSSTQKSITVKGGENIAEIALISAELELKGSETADFTKEVELKAIDQSGEVIEGIELDPVSTLVTVKISQSDISKTVKVNAIIEAALRAKYGDDIQVVPKEVVVTGPKSILESIDSINTENLVTQDLFDGGTVKKALVLPQGVKLKENEPEQIIINFF